MTVVLGLDPGTATTGYGVVEEKDGKLSLVDYGCIETKAGKELSERLDEIYDEFLEVIKKYNPNEIAIEELFFAANTKTAIVVGHARGVLMLGSEKSGKKVAEYTPLQVKQALVGYGRADKKQMQEMVKTFLNLKEVPKPDDAADALAVAICHIHSRAINSKIQNPNSPSTSLGTGK